jgi:hypothetical protein
MARAAGITDRQLQHPEVERLSRDTYLPRALSGDLRQRSAAVLLTAPAGAVLSHATAASLWGIAIPLQPIDDRRVDLIVPAGSRAESRVDRRVHRMPVESDEITRHEHFAVTVRERTWRDLAARLRPPALLAVADQLLAHGCTVGELQRQLDRRPSGRGSARARAVLPVADGRAESPMESVLRWLLHAAGLPTPISSSPSTRQGVSLSDGRISRGPTGRCWWSSTATSTGSGPSSSTTCAGRTPSSRPGRRC